MIKKVIVCGSRFGQFYIEALKNMENIELIGLLANGRIVLLSVQIITI